MGSVLIYLMTHIDSLVDNPFKIAHFWFEVGRRDIAKRIERSLDSTVTEEECTSTFTVCEQQGKLYEAGMIAFQTGKVDLARKFFEMDCYDIASVKKAIELAERAGDTPACSKLLKRAYLMCEEGFHYSQAADIAERAGDFSSAIKYFEMIGLFDRAAEVCEKQSNFPLANSYRTAIGRGEDPTIIRIVEELTTLGQDDLAKELLEKKKIVLLDYPEIEEKVKNWVHASRLSNVVGEARKRKPERIDQANKDIDSHYRELKQAEDDLKAGLIPLWGDSLPDPVSSFDEYFNHLLKARFFLNGKPPEECPREDVKEIYECMKKLEQKKNEIIQLSDDFDKFRQNRIKQLNDEKDLKLLRQAIAAWARVGRYDLVIQLAHEVGDNNLFIELCEKGQLFEIAANYLKRIHHDYEKANTLYEQAALRWEEVGCGSRAANIREKISRHFADNKCG